MALEIGLKKKKFGVRHLVRRIKQEQLYKNVSELNENISLEDFFHITGNFYNFLNCCLLIVLAKAFSLLSKILDDLECHSGQTWGKHLSACA